MNRSTIALNLYYKFPETGRINYMREPQELWLALRKHDIEVLPPHMRRGAPPDDGWTVYYTIPSTGVVTQLGETVVPLLRSWLQKSGQNRAVQLKVGRAESVARMPEEVEALWQMVESYLNETRTHDSEPATDRGAYKAELMRSRSDR